MNNTTEIKIDEHNIYEVKNKDLIRWALPVLRKISEREEWDSNIWVFDFLDYLEEEIK